MEGWWVLAAIVAVIAWAPVLLLRPLVVALANRISGKSADAQQFKLMQKKVDSLEQELAAVQHRLLSVEEESAFGRRLSEDNSKKLTENQQSEKRLG